MRAPAIPLVLALVAATALCGCAPDAAFKIAGPTVPEQLNDGWRIAKPGDVGVSAQVLDAIHADLVSEDRYYNAKSLLVVKDGLLVFETYCRDPRDRDRYGHVQSVAKSVTSLAFGELRAQGVVDSLDQTLYAILPDAFPDDADKRTITLRHLLTMRSGLSFDNEVFSTEIYGRSPVDPARYILLKPLYALPGERFYYRDCDPHLISYAVRALTGAPLDRWAEQYLFKPLGIRDYYWEPDHAGTTMGAHGLHLKPRDMAKIGQLVLDRGRWNGCQIVDSTWVDESTRRQVADAYRAGPDTYDYGYYWWIVPRWQAFTAWGHGGNFILVVPAQRLVVVMTSMPDTDDDLVGTRLETFLELVRPLLDAASTD
ncbi:MAG: beta-lactamase family protein [Candidatus Krumholzibacteria bacterium]|nr:beta-lactamase family protein [Candidatus Krumholzibacteria bacterium]